MNEAYRKYRMWFKRNLIHYRKMRHLNQEGLAIKANISRTQLSRIESRNTDDMPSFNTFFHFCAILGVEPHLFFLAPPKDNE